MGATRHPRRAEQLLTVADVARLDAVSEKTSRAIAAGLLDVIRVGPGGRLLHRSAATRLSPPPGSDLSANVQDVNRLSISGRGSP